ncbi:hypothetical protein GGI15_004566 [Coemansia interrupta]|uniref:Uncharacterized protein n=1 Tax=Coemansia interrupta TaxID=1126814 RepID=A0A9W8H262_9FUNG|nr:hypothetical protein GGI15_004566 [Coemansia interrupta]
MLRLQASPPITLLLSLLLTESPAEVEISEPIVEAADITQSHEPSADASAVAPTAADATETEKTQDEVRESGNDAATAGGIAAAATVVTAGAVAVAANAADSSKPRSSKPRALEIIKESEPSSAEQKPFDEVDSVLYPTVSERKTASAAVPSSEGAEANVTTPSYIMHYPESLFGDASSIAPGLITIEDLHIAQKASAVVGVSAVNATSIGRRSRDSGYHPTIDGDSTMGQRMKRFISGRRSDASSKTPKSPLRSSRASTDSKHVSMSPSATTVGVEDDAEAQFAQKIPGSFPSEQTSARHSDSETSHRPDQAAVQQGDSADSSDNENHPAKDKHRRHTILGVFKRIFR